MEDAMVTRKTGSKTPAAKAAKATKTTAKAETKATPVAAKRSTAAAPKKPAALAAAPAATAKGAPRIEAPTGEERYRWIAHAAYLRAEKRGFAPGQEVEDWLAAEAEFIAAFKAS
jgi:hypothetical protein